jgi:hypothetical protein
MQIMQGRGGDKNPLSRDGFKRISGVFRGQNGASGGANEALSVDNGAFSYEHTAEEAAIMAAAGTEKPSNGLVVFWFFWSGSRKRGILAL